MDRLLTELKRLYFLSNQRGQCLDSPVEGVLTPVTFAASAGGQANIAITLTGPDAMVRSLVVGIERASDWAVAARLYQILQNELELPAPALSVSGNGGYLLWLSLAECVPLAQARTFLNAFRHQFLAEIPGPNLVFYPDIDETGSAKPCALPLVPAKHALSGKWSAFIDPSMGAMFVDEPGLEMSPNMDRQADILARIESIKPPDFQRALKRLVADSAPVSASPATGSDEQRSHSETDLGNHFADPKAFLLAVMNTSSATLDQRIEAAKALLPYFEILRRPDQCQASRTSDQQFTIAQHV